VCRLPFGRWKVSKKNGVQEAPPTPVSRASNQLNSTAASSLALGDPDLFRTGQFACSEPSAAAHRQTTGCTRRRGRQIVAFDTSIRSEFQSNRGTAARLAIARQRAESSPVLTKNGFLFEKSGWQTCSGKHSRQGKFLLAQPLGKPSRNSKPVAHPTAGSDFSVAMSMTKRYLTSCLSMRSQASLIF
jgi:hypothetical protein